MEQREHDIQNFLQTLNEELEKSGCIPGTLCFDFNEYNDDNSFVKKLGFTIDYLHSLLDRCISRGYVARTTIDFDYSWITLTNLGQQYVLSNYVSHRAKTINIGQQTIVHGIAQIGNGNSQNFSNFISSIEAQIDEAHASDAEKKEAKNLLVKLSENPLVSSIIGGLISSLG